MEERDPFGREKGDDPLEDMGWSASEAAPPDAGPADIAAPEQPDDAAKRQVTHEDLPGVPSDRISTPPPTGPAPKRDHRADYRPAPGQQRRVRGCAAAGCLLPIIVLVFVIAIGAVVIGGLISSVDDELDDIVPTVPDGPSGEAPQGLEPKSMLLRGNLAPALRRIQREAGTNRLRFLRISADRVDAQAAIDDGRTRLLQATWDGKVRVIATTPGGGPANFTFSDVNASAPRRIVTASTGKRPERFDYLVLIDATGLRWSAFLKNGTHFTASPDGRDVSRVG